MEMPGICDADDGNDEELENDLDDVDLFEILGKRREPCLPSTCRRKTLHQHRIEMAMTRPLLIKQERNQDTSQRVRSNWKRLAHKARTMKDPWQAFHIEDIQTELCVRYRYNAVKEKWTEDEVLVKMEATPFNRGAMRECFRMKKRSTFTKNSDWHTTSNYVAKRYMEEVNEEVYRSDVMLQMQAKLWGEHYNRSNPPKQVDIMQMCLLRFKDREGQPLFHLEHFIEGTYIKYNSNSGFVEENLRNTPQAFSHFTFERSGHKLIVVDIQGVGDLYTDPQIHTIKGTEYGDGNLGARGMALFFHSHLCNNICESLHLTPLDMAPSEEAEQERIILSAGNSAASTVTKADLSASPCSAHAAKFEELRARCDSGVVAEEDESETSDYLSLSPSSPLEKFPRRRRLDTSSSGDIDLDYEMWHQQQCRFHRPSRFGGLLSDEVARGQNVLGQIHHEMAKFHELGRFAEPGGPVDWEAAFYHEQMAADHGFLEALLTMGRYYLGLQHDVLAECPIKAEPGDVSKGILYLTRAAEAGDRYSMVFLGECYQRGQFECERDWELAKRWYTRAVEAEDDTDCDGGYDATMDTPLYELQARIGDMLFEGGHFLEKDASAAGDIYSEAAEGATNAMKGRRAAKLYELAEIAYGEVEDEEEED